ncbi:MAG: NADPH-dependent FMN reductase [Acidimicrobiales bacterium]
MTVLYEGLDRLPHFNPDHDADPLHPAVADLRSTVQDSDAILFSTPEYAGALPGSFKNLLDWTVGDDQPGSIYQKPVAWVNVSAAPTGAADAHESLAKVLGYVHASVVKDACGDEPVATNGLPGHRDRHATRRSARRSPMRLRHLPPMLYPNHARSAGAALPLTARRSVEHHPRLEVVAHVLEAVLDTGSNKEGLALLNVVHGLPVSEPGVTPHHHVHLVLVVRALAVAVPRGVEAKLEAAALEGHGVAVVASVRVKVAWAKAVLRHRTSSYAARSFGRAARSQAEAREGWMVAQPREAR